MEFRVLFFVKPVISWEEGSTKKDLFYCPKVPFSHGYLLMLINGCLYHSGNAESFSIEKNDLMGRIAEGIMYSK